MFLLCSKYYSNVQSIFTRRICNLIINLYYLFTCFAFMCVCMLEHPGMPKYLSECQRITNSNQFFSSTMGVMGNWTHVLRLCASCTHCAILPAQLHLLLEQKTRKTAMFTITTLQCQLQSPDCLTHFWPTSLKLRTPKFTSLGLIKLPHSSALR